MSGNYRIKNGILIAMALLIVQSCDPILSSITTAPAIALGAYDKATQRKKWLAYAEKGDVYAQYELAQSYMQGDILKDANVAEGLKWYCLSAKNGYAKAQVFLGKLYENTLLLKGVTIQRNTVKAYVWYSLAARRINEEALKHKNNLKNIMSKKELDEVKSILLKLDELTCDEPWAVAR